MQFINSDNGSNIKKALLDMEKMEMTVEEEPLLLVDEDEDDWTNNAAAASHAAAMTEDSINFGPCPVPVEDEFHPVALDEEEDWDSSGYTSVAHVIANLEDKVANIRANPRINNLQRLPCFCHTIQVNHIFADSFVHIVLWKILK